MIYRIIYIRENPEFANRGIDYFSSKWSVPREVYDESISDSLTTANNLPRWYLMLKGESIVGSFGLIQNDFIDRTDLYPWLCALYIEESERGQALGARLLMYGQSEAQKLGFSKLYLATDHIGYYEKYGWEYIGDGNNTEEDGTSRLYVIDTEE